MVDAPRPDDGEDRAERPDPEETDAWRASDSTDAPARPSPVEPPAEDDDPDLEQFARDVAEAGLLGGAEVRSFLDRFTAGERPREARALARELVAAGKLTAYQAGAVCQGKAKGLVIGRYVVLEKLGAGGMGVVFKAQQSRLKRVVALKILPPSVTGDPDSVARFHREAEAAAKLDHPNLVRALDADEAGGMHFLVMEFVDGKNLGKLVRERGALPLGQAIDCVVQAARGLAAAHARGIVHRDIKPSNLMLDASGAIKVLDLGLARLDDPDLSGMGGGLTVSNAFLGTADYMSPEQAFDPRLADARSDIYSLGCTLHYLLTARPVFGGRSLMQRLLGHREGTIPSLRTSRPDVPPAFEEAFRRMVAKRPEDRPASMAEVIALLDAGRPPAGETSRSAPKVLKVFDDGRPAPPPTPRPSRRRDREAPAEEPIPLPRPDATPPDAAGADSEGSGFRSRDPSGRVFTVHGAAAIGFRRWVELVRSEGGIPTCISAFDGGGRPLFAAVSGPNRDGASWEVMLHPDALELGKYANRMQSQGSALALLAGYGVGDRIGSATLFRRATDSSGAATGLDLDALAAQLAELDRNLRRVRGIFGSPTAEGVRFAVTWGPDDGRPRRREVDLPAAPFRAFLENGRADGFLPVSLTAYPSDGPPRFGAVLRHAPGRTWEARFDLSAEALHDELARRAARGFVASLLCGYRLDGDTRYVATWVKARGGRR